MVSSLPRRSAPPARAQLRGLGPLAQLGCSAGAPLQYAMLGAMPPPCRVGLRAAGLAWGGAGQRVATSLSFATHCVTPATSSLFNDPRLSTSFPSLPPPPYADRAWRGGACGGPAARTSPQTRPIRRRSIFGNWICIECCVITASPSYSGQLVFFWSFFAFSIAPLPLFEFTVQNVRAGAWHALPGPPRRCPPRDVSSCHGCANTIRFSAFSPFVLLYFSSPIKRDGGDSLDGAKGFPCLFRRQCCNAAGRLCGALGASDEPQSCASPPVPTIGLRIRRCKARPAPGH